MQPPCENLYRYRFKNNAKRAAMFGRVCRVLARGKKNTALVEFVDDGQREFVSFNALRLVERGQKRSKA